MKFLSMFVDINDTHEKIMVIMYLNYDLWFARSNLHFSQPVQFIMNSTNFNLRILFVIDDRRTKIIIQNLVNTTSV
jgi:hypothetical protein